MLTNIGVILMGVSVMAAIVLNNDIFIMTMFIGLLFITSDLFTPNIKKW